MKSSEQRLTPRVQCFLFDDLSRQLPVWVFRPEEDVDAIVALAVDLSINGISVLVEPSSKVEMAHNCIHILPSPEIGFDGAFIGVRYCWKRADGGLFTRIGFGIEAVDDGIVENLLQLIEHRPESGSAVWLRCTLIKLA